MTRYFRDKEVIGWVIADAISPDLLCFKINELMDKYEIVDCQYSTTGRNTYTVYSALVLIAVKGDR